MLRLGAAIMIIYMKMIICDGDDPDMRQNAQVGGCGEHQVCAEEEEGELMGESFYYKSCQGELIDNP